MWVTGMIGIGIYVFDKVLWLSILQYWNFPEWKLVDWIIFVLALIFYFAVWVMAGIGIPHLWIKIWTQKSKVTTTNGVHDYSNI